MPNKDSNNNAKDARRTTVSVFAEPQHRTIESTYACEWILFPARRRGLGWVQEPKRHTVC